MNVTLRPDLERFIEEKVRAGQYAAVSDVVNGALELMREQEDQTPEDADELRRKIQSGVEQLDRGEGTPWDAEEVKAGGRRLLAARTRNRE